VVSSQKERKKKSSSSRSFSAVLSSPNLLDLGRPAIDALALAADLDLKLALAFHAPRALHERVVGHAAGVGALGGHELEHGQEEVADAARLLDAEVVLLTQDVGKGPVAQAVDVTELAFAVEDFLRPFAADAEGFGERAQQLDDLCYVIVVFAVLCARLGVEEVVACDEFEGLESVVSMLSSRLCTNKTENSKLTHHSSHTPNIRTGAPLRPKDYFRRTVLSRLDVVCEVVSNPACITQIGDLDGNNINALGLVLLELF
jgi:hypothetical protein